MTDREVRWFMQDFRNVETWKKSHRLTLDVYRATAAFPKQELYGLTSQLRRSAASVPANIAEGCGRGSDADFARFLHIAMGSASELQYHLLLARDLSYLHEDSYRQLHANVAEVKRMLAGLIAKLKADS